MSARGLQTLLFTSLTDRRHADSLLHGTPAACDGFDLTAPEVATLMSIQANTLEEFARSAHVLFYSEALPIAGVVSTGLADLGAERDVA